MIFTCEKASRSSRDDLHIPLAADLDARHRRQDGSAARHQLVVDLLERRRSSRHSGGRVKVAGTPVAGEADAPGYLRQGEVPVRYGAADRDAPGCGRVAGGDVLAK